MVNIREITEDAEFKYLSPKASFAKKSRGRKIYEEPCLIRTDYQRDRDRILHSKSFRRLKHKTQVFISPLGDHYRTRLTHTLEVAQISRTVSRALKLNEDLTEAIALGHDIGHAPFGHAGEAILNELCSVGFKHYKQSFRILDVLEKEGKGLNLTWEVLDGVLCHTEGKESATLEGQIVRICDKIAYINHDIEDSIRAGILKLNSLPKHFRDIICDKTSGTINALVTALIENSRDGIITLGDDIGGVFKEVHEFMYQNVYLDKKSISEEYKVPFVISSLYDHFRAHKDQIPRYLIDLSPNEEIDIAICDYIAGMTDQFAISLFKDIFLPRSSKIF